MANELILKTWGDPSLNYKDIYGSESFGEKGGFGIRIFATVNREPSEDEKIAIYKAVDIITKAIRSENLRLDPEAQKRKKEERAAILKCFILPLQAEELPNSYCSDWCCTQRPWYRVLTTSGWVKIGWRRGVINIDWTDTVNRKSGAELFPDYEWTKSSTHDENRYIHAYGYESAADLLAVIIQ